MTTRPDLRISVCRACGKYTMLMRLPRTGVWVCTMGDDKDGKPIPSIKCFNKYKAKHAPVVTSG